jgi:hypothetical protein
MQNTESSEYKVTADQALMLSYETSCQIEQRLAIMLSKTSWVARQESIASFSSDLGDTTDVELA